MHLSVFCLRARVLPLVLAISSTFPSAGRIAPAVATATIRTFTKNIDLKNKSTMPEKRKVPVISSYEDFECQLSGYLNPNEPLSILLDYDGTLAKIAENPQYTTMSEEMRDLLLRVKQHPNIFLAVISGRALKDVKSRVKICGITYGGNHGIEIEGPDGTRHDFVMPMEVLENYKSLMKELEAKMVKNGAWLEDKDISITYHYGDVPPELLEEQKQMTIDIIAKHCYLSHQAIGAVEARPPVSWNKGNASLFLLSQRFGDNWQAKTKVIFAGDDTTDEDAMKALQGSGKSFRISADPEIETFADFRLEKQDLMYCLLQWISSVYKV